MRDNFDFGRVPLLMITMATCEIASDVSAEPNDERARLVQIMTSLVPVGGAILVDTLLELQWLAILFGEARLNRWDLQRVDFGDLEAVLLQMTQRRFDVIYVTRPKAVPTGFELNRLRMLADQFRAHLVVGAAVWEHHIDR